LKKSFIGHIINIFNSNYNTKFTHYIITSI
jgi:hypothetical protein